eukprot:GCRY01001108.1.p1 GENE.GCRY01001108.1~~GCRY01001108.1.p1  ORF type:complete len:388 (+),score=35.96 GCRY01001108.1:268-1431(+)
METVKEENHTLEIVKNIHERQSTLSVKLSAFETFLSCLEADVTEAASEFDNDLSNLTELFSSKLECQTFSEDNEKTGSQKTSSSSTVFRTQGSTSWDTVLKENLRRLDEILSSSATVKSTFQEGKIHLENCISQIQDDILSLNTLYLNHSKSILKQIITCETEGKRFSNQIETIQKTQQVLLARIRGMEEKLERSIKNCLLLHQKEQAAASFQTAETFDNPSFGDKTGQQESIPPFISPKEFSESFDTLEGRIAAGEETLTMFLDQKSKREEEDNERFMTLEQSLSDLQLAFGTAEANLKLQIEASLQNIPGNFPLGSIQSDLRQLQKQVESLRVKTCSNHMETEYTVRQSAFHLWHSLIRNIQRGDFLTISCLSFLFVVTFFVFVC